MATNIYSTRSFSISVENGTVVLKKGKLKKAISFEEFRLFRNCIEIIDNSINMAQKMKTNGSYGLFYLSKNSPLHVRVFLNDVVFIRFEEFSSNMVQVTNSMFSMTIREYDIVKKSLNEIDLQMLNLLKTE